MNKLKFLTTLFILLYFILISADTDQQKFNIANEHFKNQISLRDKRDIQIPRWITSRINKESHHFQKTNFVENSREVIDVKVNGDDQTTILQGEDIVITIYFSDDCFEAHVEMWADMNENGIWDENIDLPIPENEDTIIDNEPEDEDPTIGVYQLTLSSEEEGTTAVSNLGLLFLAEDTGGFDEAYAYINPIITNYSISGDITPITPNLIVMAINQDDEMWMTTTNNSGSYQNYVAESGSYYLVAFDPLDILNGMFSTSIYDNVNIDGHLTGYDFSFEPGNSAIEGTVIDENNNPLEGITIYVDNEGPIGVWAETDINGFYTVSIIEGYWYVDMENDDLLPDYMAQDEVELYVEEGAVEVVDFIVYSTDASITGTIFLDGIPASGFKIHAYNENIGYSYIESTNDGMFDLPTSSVANVTGGYDVYVDIEDYPNLFVDEFYSNIMTGSIGLDFHIHTATSGLEGYIYDSTTLEPTEDCWIFTTNGTNFFSSGVDEDGYYLINLPNGTYDVWVQGNMYYMEGIEDVVINNEYVNLDFYLDPVIFEGALEGFVYEEGTIIPISFVDINIYNNIYWTNTTTDESGYYYIDLPNGTFALNARHPNYYDENITDITINNNVVQLNIEMEPLIFDGTLQGTVFEEGTIIPVNNTEILVSNQSYEMTVWSDENGFYSVDLPNGVYALNCWKYGYQDTYLENIEINDNIVDLNIYMLPDVAVESILKPEINLLSNHPNPFNPSTTISFRISNEQLEEVELGIYNLKGQRVKNLSPSLCHLELIEGQGGNTYRIIWDGTDQNNNTVSSGIYFYKLKAGNFEKTKKMILLK